MEKQIEENITCINFCKNERIVWDSGFGYEIGVFKGDGLLYGTYSIDISTGINIGLVSHSISKIHKYSNELIDELTKKYGYEKRFSETF